MYKYFDNFYFPKNFLKHNVSKKNKIFLLHQEDNSYNGSKKKHNKHGIIMYIENLNAT